MMLLFGLIDDWRELSVSSKLLSQLFGITVLVIFGIRTRIVYLGVIPNLIVTYLWVLALTNAFNHLDVMDACAGISALSAIAGFFLISVFNADPRTMILTSLLFASTLSFLFFNLPPARLYMGNAGSHFLGFVTASIALMISYAPLERKVALLSPILVMGFPLYDTFFLILARMIKKKIPFKKSNDHLVLRFLAMGYSKERTFFFILLLNLVFVASGVIVSQSSNLLGIVTVLITFLINLALTLKMVKVKVNG
jgi:UDP-GlcNAc:undecaprenyl-phosphate GlcNAc-1-phosphate transferase